MKRKILFVLVAFLFIHSGNIFSQIQITNYTNKNNVNAVAVSGDNVWLATSGGIVHRKTDGTLVATYTVDEGLPYNYVTTIFADSQGNIWCGTWNGVVKFDGSGMTIHNEVSSAELIYEDSQGNIWFARNWSGLVKYDGSSWTTYTTSDGLAYNYVYTIHEDNLGNLWFGYGYYNYGVTKFDGTNRTTYTIADGLVNDAVFVIEQDNSGNMWFGTYGSGVSKFDGASWENFTGSDFLLGDNVYDIHKDSDGNLWFGIYGGGINKYDGSTWSVFTQNDSLSSNYNYYIFEDTQGNIWFHGYSLDKFDGTQFTNYTTSNGLSGYWIYENLLTEDQTGNLWIGHSHRYKGLDKFDGSTFTNYLVDFEINSNNIYDIEKDYNGDLWFAVSGADSLLKFDGTNWSYPGYHMGINTSNAYSLFEDRDNNLWFGLWSEVGKWDGTTWTWYYSSDGLGARSIESMSQDISGNMWFAGSSSSSAGVSKFDGITWDTITMNDGLDTNMVYALLADSQGNIWFGYGYYSKGVTKYDGTTWTTYTSADGVASTRVYSLFEDSKGNIWVGGSSGISMYDGTNWTSYSWSEGYPGGYVYEIKEDEFGIFWLATGYGLVKFDGANWGHYTMESNGLLDNNLRVVEFDDNGNVWIGTYYGLSVATCEDPITDFDFSNTTIGDTTFLINFSSRVDALTRYEWDIGSDGSVESTNKHFKWKFDNPGTYIVELTAFNDNCSASVTKEVDVKEVVNSFPYNEDFESGRGYWTAHGINNSWEYGTPAGPTINYAYSGNNVWVTNLSGDYNADEKSWVIGPPFDFSSLNYPVFEFKVWWDAEGFYDGANLQYKIGNGSWETAGTLIGGQNWYNSPYLYSLATGFGLQTENAIGWSGDGEWGYGSNDWVTARYGLFNLGNQSDVKLRIAFASNAEYQNDGFAFDDVSIFQSPVGIDPVTGVLSGIEIYPNPNKGMFYLDFTGENDIKLKLELINLQGQVVFNEETHLSNQFRKELDVSYLPAGICYLKMTYKDTVVVKKIVIE